MSSGVGDLGSMPNAVSVMDHADHEWITRRISWLTEQCRSHDLQ